MKLAGKVSGATDDIEHIDQANLADAISMGTPAPMVSLSGMAPATSGPPRHGFGHLSAATGGTQRRNRYGAHPGVSQVSRSPDCSPSFSAISRCSDEPCVHDSGET